MIYLLVIIFIVIMFIEVPVLIRNKYWHELKIFTGFLILAFVLSLFYIMSIPIPNPIKGQEYLIKDILHLNYK